MYNDFANIVLLEKENDVKKKYMIFVVFFFVILIFYFVNYVFQNVEPNKTRYGIYVTAVISYYIGVCFGYFFKK